MRKPLLVLLLACLMIIACDHDPVATNKTTNKDIQVDFLFEHDGCKIYRFSDGGMNIYYSKCDGAAHSDVTWNRPEGNAENRPTQVNTN